MRRNQDPIQDWETIVPLLGVGHISTLDMTQAERKKAKRSKKVGFQRPRGKRK